MSRQEIESFFESCRDVFLLFLPYLFVGLVASLMDFLKKHLGKERFQLTKLLVGLASDMFLAFVAACVGHEAGLGSFGIAALVAVVVHRGGEWVDRIVDRRLDAEVKEDDEDGD